MRISEKVIHTISSLIHRDRDVQSWIHCLAWKFRRIGRSFV